ncbi:ricin-type beta-trefoil lectin domain protein [Kitasatospora sp. McL0602]|uniref:ricin-type beta-trefoil lectin domain protein n=1 Tax=Kitasatospora sp. McL0602 TaxID=3439530 RepID=UPI003F8A4D89
MSIGAVALAVVAGAGPAGVGSAVAGTAAVCGNPAATTPVAAGRYGVSPGAWNTDFAKANVCVTTTGAAQFTVSSSTLTTTPEVRQKPEGPAAYPFITPTSVSPAHQLSLATLGDSTTSWSITQPAAGSYDVAYDLWFSHDGVGCSPTASDEVMIWLSARGATPYGDPVGTATVGGTDYSLTATAVSSEHMLINYQLPDSTTSVSRLDVRPFVLDAVTRGLLKRSESLCGVSAGFELWDGGAGFATNSFSFERVAGSPTGTVAAGLPGRCLDDYHSQPADGNPVVLYGCNGTDAQSWTAAIDGTLRVFGKCLAPVGDQPAVSTPIVLTTCADNPAGDGAAATQQWRPGPAHALVDVASGLCLDDPGSSTTQGIQLQLYTCNGTAAQQWRLPYNGAQVSGGLTNAAGGNCLTGTADGAPAALLACTYTGSQIWTLANDGTLQALGRCLQPSAATPGATALATCDGSSAQRWAVHPDGYLSHLLTGDCLGDPQGSVLQLAPCTGTADQTWYLPV